MSNTIWHITDPDHPQETNEIIPQGDTTLYAQKAYIVNGDHMEQLDLFKSTCRLMRGILKYDN